MKKDFYKKCVLCPSREGVLKPTDTGGWAHVICGLYINEVVFGNMQMMEPIIITNVPKDRFEQTCSICTEKQQHHMAGQGACMSCSKSGCKSSFHVTCAQEKGYLFEESHEGSEGSVSYRGYCAVHINKLRNNGKIKRTSVTMNHLLGDSSATESKTPDSTSSLESPVGTDSKLTNGSLTESPIQAISSLETIPKTESQTVVPREAQSSSTPPHNGFLSPNGDVYPPRNGNPDQSADNSTLKRQNHTSNKYSNNNGNQPPPKRPRVKVRRGTDGDLSSQKQSSAASRRTSTNGPNSSPSNQSQTSPSAAAVAESKSDWHKSRRHSSNHNSPVKSSPNAPIKMADCQTQTSAAYERPFSNPKGDGLMGFGGHSHSVASMVSLLEEQWEQGSQFLMLQGKQYNIPSLLSSLYELQAENQQLECQLNDMSTRRHQLHQMNQRLSVPLYHSTPSPRNQQGSSSDGGGPSTAPGGRGTPTVSRSSTQQLGGGGGGSSNLDQSSSLQSQENQLMISPSNGMLMCEAAAGGSNGATPGGGGGRTPTNSGGGGSSNHRASSTTPSNTCPPPVMASPGSGGGGGGASQQPQPTAGLSYLDQAAAANTYNMIAQQMAYHRVLGGIPPPSNPPPPPPTTLAAQSQAESMLTQNYRIAASLPSHLNAAIDYFDANAAQVLLNPMLSLFNPAAAR